MSVSTNGESSELRPAWLIWRQRPRGDLSGIVQFDSLPGPDARAYGPKILSEHAITGDLLVAVNHSSAEGIPWAALYAAYPHVKTTVAQAA